jgi:hypothetical protein
MFSHLPNHPLPCAGVLSRLRSIKTTLSRIIPSSAQLFHAMRQSLAAGKSILKIVLERCRCSSTHDYDQIIILPLESRGREIRRAAAEQSPVDLVALKMHRRAWLRRPNEPGKDDGRGMDETLTKGRKSARPKGQKKRKTCSAVL